MPGVVAQPSQGPQGRSGVLARDVWFTPVSQVPCSERAEPAFLRLCVP